MSRELNRKPAKGFRSRFSVTDNEQDLNSYHARGGVDSFILLIILKYQIL